MTKMLNIVTVVLIICFPALSSAEYCKDSYRGKEFYSASVGDSNGVNCEYRYCYYGCEYESYTISGRYIPSSRSALYWEKVDGGYSCSGDNYKCEFVAK